MIPWYTQKKYQRNKIKIIKSGTWEYIPPEQSPGQEERGRLSALAFAALFKGFPGASQKRLWLHAQRLWTVALILIYMNGGRNTRLVIRHKHTDTDVCRVWEQLPLPAHTHAAHKVSLRTSRAILLYAQSASSVNLLKLLRTSLQRNKKRKLLQ